MDVRDESFLAAISFRHLCIGKRLKPYSIGHQIALKATDNAFVRDLGYPIELRDTPTFPDLIEAAFICSRTFEDGQHDIHSRWLPLKMKLWGKSAGKFDVVAEILNLQRLIASENERIQDVNRIENGQSRPLPASPWENRLRIWLLREGLAKSQSEAWNYPLRQAIIDEATTGEMDGAVSFFSDVDRELMRVAKGLNEQAVAE